MGFLDQKQDSFLVDVPVGAQAAIQVRPIQKEPQQKWAHVIPAVFSGQTDAQGKPILLRQFATEPCLSTYGGAGCDMCHMTDPFWDKLAQKDQFDRKGNRKDFGKTPKFILAVYNWNTGAVQLLEKGQQIYKDMNKMYDQGQDIRSIDWLLWKTGSSDRTEYMSSPVVDPTKNGQITAEQMAEFVRQAKELLVANERRWQPTPKERLIANINGSNMQQQAAGPISTPITPPQAPQLPPAVAQPPMPQFVPQAQAVPMPPVMGYPTPQPVTPPMAPPAPMFTPPQTIPQPPAPPPAFTAPPPPWQTPPAPAAPVFQAPTLPVQAIVPPLPPQPMGGQMGVPMPFVGGGTAVPMPSLVPPPPNFK